MLMLHAADALKNERNIVDNISKESVGFVCTVSPEMPISRENGGISFGEAGRHSAAAASVAASLKNPKKDLRYHYLASSYTWEVTPREGNVPEELSRVIGSSSDFSLPTSSEECIIYCR